MRADLQDRIIGVPPAGCAVLAYNYFGHRHGGGCHGRAGALATGLSVHCRTVWSLRIKEMVTLRHRHGRNDSRRARGENITTLFVNNAVYG